MTERLAGNPFSWYPYGSNEKVEITEVGDPDGLPFVVRVAEYDFTGGAWIPVNVLVFAQSVQDAKDRVQAALKVMLQELQKKLSQFPDPRDTSCVITRRQVSAIIRIVELTEGRPSMIENTAIFEAQLFDMRQACSVSWASRQIGG